MFGAEKPVTPSRPGCSESSVLQSVAAVLAGRVHSDDVRRKQGIEMPKLKTNRAAAKRFRKTGGGKFKAGHAFKSHILTKKSTKRKRGLRGSQIIGPTEHHRIVRMMPYA